MSIADGTVTPTQANSVTPKATNSELPTPLFEGPNDGTAVFNKLNVETSALTVNTPETPKPNKSPWPAWSLKDVLPD